MGAFFGKALVSVCLGLALFSTPVHAADNGPAALGPHGVAAGDYKFPAKLDPEVNPTLPVELWARVWYPSDVNGVPHPLVLLLHGNHETCGYYIKSQSGHIDDSISYTKKGTCPTGYMVVQSHIGYSYLAENLASWGFIVVSINANRGINGADGLPGDDGLNLVRGRLVLRHLQLWTQWNRTGAGFPSTLGFNPRKTIDFSRVGLMGHSRGGEGMLAALAQYNDAGSPWPQRIDPSLRVKSIFEIEPVDGQTSRVFTANNVNWAVLLGTCDGDVYNLQGQKVFDRTIGGLQESAPGFKGTFVVSGANHDFYNTEWQASDLSSCPTHAMLFDPYSVGSATQRVTGLYPFSAFFRGTLAAPSDHTPPSLKGLFEPSVPLPPLLSQITEIYRGYADSASTATELRFDDFDQTTGTNTWGTTNDAVNITYSHAAVFEHQVQAAHISWDKKASPGASYFQSNWAPVQGGRDASGFATLEFRISPDCPHFKKYRWCSGADPLNANGQGRNFSIQLIDSQGRASKGLALASYISVEKFGSAQNTFPNYHATLPSVRIRLGDFGTFALQRLRGVRFTFDRTTSGSVQIANLRLSNKPNPSTTVPAPLSPADQTLIALAHQQAGGPVVSGTLRAASPASSFGNDVVAIRHLASSGPKVGASASVAAAPGQVEIQLHSLKPIPVTDSLLTLQVGSSAFVLSRFVEGSTKDVAFTLPQSDFDRLQDGSAITLAAGVDQRNFGALSKAMLK